MSLISQVQDLAKEAGQAILGIYHSGQYQIQDKADASPVTDADLLAHRIITEGLKKIDSALIISEEDKPTIGVSQTPCDRFWLVDPLDGTLDFIHKRDHFVVCIALIEKSRPVLGVIYSPVFSELYSAESGLGANCNGQKITNLRRNPTDWIALASQAHPSKRMNALKNILPLSNIERYGSALKFGRLASGQADLYARLGDTYEWDTAAGQIICEEANCKIVDVQTGESLKYGKARFLNQGFIASRSNLQVFETLKNHMILK